MLHKGFALSWTETTSADRLIRGMHFINNIPMVFIIDTGAIRSFISLDYSKRLDLKLSYMVGNGSITTSMVCLKSPLTIYGKIFVMDLFCL